MKVLKTGKSRKNKTNTIAIHKTNTNLEKPDFGLLIVFMGKYMSIRGLKVKSMKSYPVKQTWEKYPQKAY